MSFLFGFCFGLTKKVRRIVAGIVTSLSKNFIV